MTTTTIGAQHILELWKDELIKTMHNPQPGPWAAITVSPDNKFYFHVY